MCFRVSVAFIAVDYDQTDQRRATVVAVRQAWDQR